MEKHNPAILDMIARYKVHLREHGLADELYKWELIGKFQGRPDVEAADLLGEISAVNFGNLPYQFGLSALKQLARERPEQLRVCLRALLDESVSIDERIQRYFQDTLALYREFVPENRYGHYQDERMAGVLLAFHAPDRYVIYKDSFYKKLCKLLGIQHKWKGEKYGHFQELATAIARDYVAQDAELLALMREKLTATVYADPNHLLLTQNILYVVLDLGKGIEQEDEEDESQIENPSMKDRKYPLNQILYGPPGTGKTYHTINRALEILGEKTQDRAEMKRIFEEKLNAGQIAFVTFHQSMSYEDFVEGIKPIPPAADGSSLGYEIQEGIFRKMCMHAQLKRSTWSIDDAYEQYVADVIESGGLELKTMVQQKPFNVKINSAKTSVAIPKTEKATEMGITKPMLTEYVLFGTIREWKPYTTAIGEYFKSKYFKSAPSEKETVLPHILIIDEINRGNVSQIFGELITLIEEDKRAGAKEALSVTLPYSKDTFSVPPNLYIIGTMNTADRSVEALDTALRRRFEFIEMAPDLTKVSENLPDNSDVSPRNILRAINLRIEKLLDRDHQIGHAYFMGLENIAQLQHAFEHKLLPLLQEYFYGDYAKIGLVLGKGFVYQASGHSQKAADIFANFQTDAASDLAQREVWHLRKIGQMSSDDFKAALNDLKPMPEATA